MESYDSFIERLASPSPAPGGGAASAMVSIVSASLTSMVASLTIGKKNYLEYDEEMKKIIEKSSSLREELRALMKEDEDAFNNIVSAWKLPKGTDDEKKTRKESIDAATKEAIRVPWKIAGKSMEILDLSLQAAEHGNKNTITDAACAAIFAHGAIKGVLYNVKINLKSVTDEKMRDSEELKMKFFLEDADSIYDKTIKKVDEVISR